MGENSSSFDENELSPEDLEILRAFEAKETWEATNSSPTAPKVHKEEAAESWILVFLNEAAEDVAKLHRAFSQIESETHISSARFTTLQRVAHKIRGAAGAVECHGIATVAQYIEQVAEQVVQGRIFPTLVLPSFNQAITALEAALHRLAATGSEGQLPLAYLESELQRLQTHIQAPRSPEGERETAHDDDEAMHNPSGPLSSAGSSHTLQRPFMPFIRVDGRRVSRAIHYSEQLTELRATLAIAQEQLEGAMQELHAAQSRLRLFQPQLSSLFFAERQAVSLPDELSSSSLVSRILHNAHQSRAPGMRSDVTHTAKPAANVHPVSPTRISLGDELNMENYSERDMFVRSLTEAIADVTIASAHVDAASTTLLMRQQEYMAQVSALHSAIMLLRLVPLKTLVSRLQRAVSTSALPITFDVVGEEIEADQGILDSLAYPLSQMVRTCLADSSVILDATSTPRLWLHAASVGNEIALEIGFSMPVNGGAMEIIREPMLRLNGSYTLQRNTEGGITFLLRFPRSHGTAQCLVVRVGQQQLLVPFAQILRIVELSPEHEQPELLFHLSDLLGFPGDTSSQVHVQPLLLLARNTASRHQPGVLVDEVLGESELIVKPLAPYLQRPGVSGATIDGHGNVLLLLDLPELVRLRLQVTSPVSIPPVENAALADATRDTRQSGEPRILVADDSVSLRRALCQTLRHAHYTVSEARDGMEALEMMLEDPPDLCLLDIEMPNLNGFDLLSLRRMYPELARVRVVMLTSRSSEQHMQRARELGAHAYLIKPCAQDTLMETVQTLLNRPVEP